VGVKRTLMTLPAPIAAMANAAFYPDRPAAVALVQTHISYVFLAGDDVYKVKKPVRFSFLDFSTLALRHHFCHEEVRLNRRLAPGVYHGVVAICREDQSYRLGREDDPNAVEFAVHMERLPDERILARLLDRNEATLQMIDRIAAHMAEFHRHADAGPEVTANGNRDAIRRVLEDNFSGVRPFRDLTLPAADDDVIQAFCSTFLDREASLFSQRQANRRIRDCHGDLHAEHIVVDDRIVIFDCIEFNPRFRYCDVASEIAFLAMDLDHRGHPELSARLITEYARLAEDVDLRQLVPFYQCYRAYVRGKVDSLKSAEPEVEPAERAAARLSARRHFALAYRYTWAYRPCLVVIVGLSGSGKSTVAIALHERTGFAHFNSDVIRKELAGLPPDARAGAQYGVDLYTPERSAQTYQTMLARAEAELAAGRGAIVDATFLHRSNRDSVRDIASTHKMPFLFVECCCPAEIVRQRLDERVRADIGPSDADWQIYLEQRQRYEPFAPEEASDRLVIDTTGPRDRLLSVIEQALRERT